MNDVEILDTVADYRQWVSDDFYLGLEKFRVDGSSWAGDRFCRKGFGSNPGDGSVRNEVQRSHISMKCPKRGNDVYTSKLVGRLNRMVLGIGSLLPFWSLVKRFVKGSWLWITYEFDVNRFNLEDSWRLLAGEVNRHFAWLRKKFGGLTYWWFRQAHPKSGPAFGYCHLHVIVRFAEHLFDGFRHVDKFGKLSWRIERGDKDAIATNWRNGFVDVKMVRSVAGVVKYGGRYGSRDLSKGKADLTLALGWNQKVRGFSMSRVWSRLAAARRPSVDEISIVANSNPVDRVGLVFVRYRVVFKGHRDPLVFVVGGSEFPERNPFLARSGGFPA